MFRKRKTPGPYFRLPNPSNPITGDAEYLFPPLKQYCRFVLTEALSRTDESAKAELTTPQQWGPAPIHHTPDVIIHVHNLLSKDNTTYVYQGAVDDIGFAVWDHNNQWRIVHMGPGGTVGGCLNEDHPGRATVFELTLGVWNATTMKWDYTGGTVKGIDHRFGVPYPTGHATGLFEARPSVTWGTVWEVVSLDCESPGNCGD